jgi:50S ribosomal protein L16 3-hydroxylase
MNAPLGELGTDAFLESFWQKKPCLIRQAFPDFIPELDMNDIAGLACEPLAESRLVSGSFSEQNWQLRYGPFDEQDFAALPDTCWTLLVQDVEKHYPPLGALLESFSFLPCWRLDDLMVSVAGAGGSVGPHVDQYDVFLIQAQGRRRWQLAETFDERLLAGCELNVLAAFEPEREWVLEPGDMLYLPPGVAHHGVALEQGMTWSVGMRAPSTADLLQALGEWLAENRGEGKRYSDRSISHPGRCGEIDADAIARFRQMPLAAMDFEADFSLFLGWFLSRYRLAQEPAPPPDPIDSDQLRVVLGQGAKIRRNPWTRMMWIQIESEATLFATGEAFSCTPALAEWACGHPLEISTQADRASLQIELVRTLISRGHLFLEHPT